MGKLKIYQLLLRAFHSSKGPECPGGLCGKFNDITEQRLAYIKSLSIDAIWYTGVIAHGARSVYPGLQECARCIVKGDAGSPYAVRDWYDVDPDLSVSVDDRMREFEDMVSRTHKAGMKVFIDLVPNHVFRQYHSETDNFANDNFYILDAPLRLPDGLTGYSEDPAKATGNDCFSPAPSAFDWYETVKLNYGNRSTWDKMLRIILFWLSKGVDGFRCDMVEMVPVEFFGWALSIVRKEYPDAIFIGEVYNTDNYQPYISQGGFDYLYDKSLTYDFLRKVLSGESTASLLTDLWRRRDEKGEDVKSRLLNFVENHDEQRLASDFVAHNGHRALCAFAYALLFDNSPFMLYFGQELGERGMQAEGYSGRDGRTSIFDYCTVPSVADLLEDRLSDEQKDLLDQYRKLLALADDERFCEGEVYDLNWFNSQSAGFDTRKHFAFLRSSKGKAALVVLNFSNESASVTVKIPQHAFDHLALPQHIPHMVVATPASGGVKVINL